MTELQTAYVGRHAAPPADDDAWMAELFAPAGLQSGLPSGLASVQSHHGNGGDSGPTLLRRVLVTTLVAVGALLAGALFVVLV